MSYTQKHIRGQRGEAVTAQFLNDQGFRIVARNYQKKYGEIDLIAQRDDLLVFVEVKTRAHELFDLSELITRSKQQKIIKTAKAYIAENHCDDKACRFDVALLEDNEHGTISYIPNAFTEE